MRKKIYLFGLLFTVVIGVISYFGFSASFGQGSMFVRNESVITPQITSPVAGSTISGVVDIVSSYGNIGTPYFGINTRRSAWPNWELSSVYSNESLKSGNRTSFDTRTLPNGDYKLLTSVNTVSSASGELFTKHFTIPVTIDNVAPKPSVRVLSFSPKKLDPGNPIAGSKMSFKLAFSDVIPEVIQGKYNYSISTDGLGMKSSINESCSPSKTKVKGYNVYDCQYILSKAKWGNNDFSFNLWTEFDYNYNRYRLTIR